MAPIFTCIFLVSPLFGLKHTQDLMLHARVASALSWLSKAPEQVIMELLTGREFLRCVWLMTVLPKVASALFGASLGRGLERLKL